MIIDTHAHLADAVFDNDLPQVLQRSQTAGIIYIIAVSENLMDAEKILRLSDKYQMIKPAIGLYPTELDWEQCERVAEIIRTNRHRLTAIGEVGLDFWKVKEEEEREIQKAIFAEMIKLSKETILPLNVHSRSAGRHAIQFLLEHNAQKVQMHAFDGKSSYAMSAVEAGYYFSIPPSVVRSPQKQKLVKRLPLSSILLESDSPVLAPNPSQRNEPMNIITAVKCIAGLKGISEEQVIKTAYENTLRLYEDL